MPKGEELAPPVPYVDLAAQSREEGAALRQCIERVLARGDFVLGQEVGEFEDAICAYTGARHAVALGSGTDALILAMRALGVGPGDEVITPPNSFITSTSSIALLGATPVFADVGDDHNIDPDAIERAITPRSRAIMAVHLTGRAADMAAIGRIAKDHGLAVIEDAAQSVGAAIDGRMTGRWGDVGCFSAHPLKNLNACGDAGFVLTDDPEIVERLGGLRNAGLRGRDTMVEFAGVSRMDTIQAAVLIMRLARLDGVIARRRANAMLYRELLDSRHVFHPDEGARRFDTYHTFVIEVDRRDALKESLAERGIRTAVHYPVPIHLQPGANSLGYGAGDFPAAERQAGRILTLPIHQFLDADQIGAVADAVNAFCRG